MSGTPNPTNDIIFGNGNSRILVETPDSTVIHIGPSSGGPFLKPRFIDQLSGALAFLAGPLVGQGSHHILYSKPCYLMRANASINGSLGSVTKTPVGNAPGTLALSFTEETLHAQFVSNGAAMNLNSGWSLPSSPLFITITSGVGTVAHTQTFTYLDESGKSKTLAVSITAAGDVTTSVRMKKIISVTSNIDPVGTQDYIAAYETPVDRFDVRIKWDTGGQISGGYKQPKFKWSADNGRTYSKTISLPSTGIADLQTYAGGQLPQATGIRLTFSPGTITVPEYGSVRTSGATVNGDLLWTALKLGVTIAIVVAGNNTALSVGQVGDAITIYSATDGAGAATSTGNTIYDYFTTDTNASTIAARQRLRLRKVGTGAGLTAAVAASAFTNTHINWTAKQEGVRLTVIETGISQSRRVEVSSKDVYIYTDTDANGIRTSTATQLTTLVSGNTNAAKLLSGTASGTGAGLAGDTVGFLSLITSFETGDEYFFRTTPPKMSNADIAEALEALELRQEIVNKISGICIIKDGASQTDFNTLHAKINLMQTSFKQFLFGVISSDLQDLDNEDEQTWVDRIIANYTTRGTKISLVAGDIDTLIPCYGAECRRNKQMLYISRSMICPISEFSSHVQCDTLNGTKFALEGVGSHLVEGSDPNKPEYRSLYQSEAALVQLHAENMVTFRTWPKLSGVYVRQAVQYTEDGDDWVFFPARRIGDVIAQLAYIETLRLVNAGLLSDPATGLLAEIEHQKIEAAVGDYVGAKMFNDGTGRQHVSGLEVISDRTIDYVRTLSVALQINFVLKSPLTRITTTINVVKTLKTAQEGIPA